MIRNCPKKPVPPVRGLALECPRTHERLTPTTERGVLHCGACEELVYESWSEDEAREHIEAGRCVVQMFISPSARGRPKVPGRPRRARLEACAECGVPLDPRQAKCDRCGTAV